eukprot:2644240-Pleurochrysis_carterae.AAC.1
MPTAPERINVIARAGNAASVFVHAGSRLRASPRTHYGPCAAARACFNQHALRVETLSSLRAYSDSYNNHIHATPNRNATARTFSSIRNASSQLTAVSSDYISLPAQRRQVSVQQLIIDPTHQDAR